MKGYSHALSGAAGWLAVTSTSQAALGLTVATPATVLGGSILCAGAALAPDCDHPSGTIAWSLPPVKAGSITLVPSPTMALCKGVHTISGGHRHGTHSIIGIGVFGALAWLSAMVLFPVAGRELALLATLYSVLLLAFAMKALGITRELGKTSRRTGIVGAIVGGILKSWIGPWVVAFGAAGAATWYFGYDWLWLWSAVTLGAYLHCVGDSLTPEGVPWLWPWNPAPPKWLRNAPVIGGIVGVVWQPNGYFRIPLLGTVDLEKKFTRENAFAFLMSVYVIYLVAYEVTQLADLNMLI